MRDKNSMRKKSKKDVAGTPRLYDRIRDILETARANVARTVNTTQVMANWLIGREIVEDQQQGKKRAGYGEALLADLAKRLKIEFGSGYGVDNLELCRRFYLEHPRLLKEQKSDTLSRKSGNSAGSIINSDALRRNSAALPLLPLAQPMASDSFWSPGQLNANLAWSHYRRLLRIARTEARNFYEIEATRNAWSARELERQINSFLFDRLAKSKDKEGLLQLATHGQEVAQPFDVLKDPVVMEFLGLPESTKLVESKLERALIDNLQHFLLELGKGFAFVSRQERITLDGDHFYIDLIFYHTILKCYVLIDLKVGKLTHGDLGQMQFYVNYYDKERRTEGDNPTLGLILCPDKNDAVVKYTLGEQLKRNIFTSRYQLHLPTEEELQQELRRELRHLVPPAQKPSKKRARKS
jgi:predicted nuclease of restriction endonuclease-like (RecB) superfamily